MNLIELGNTGIHVTPAGFGVLTIGPWQMNLSIEDGAAVLRYALDRGINFLDTAQYYKTYPYIKKALEGFNGDVVIASKSLDPSYHEMKMAVEEARHELDRDVIDIFMLHEVRSGSDWNDRKGAWEYLQEAKSRGMVKAVGISTHHVDVAEFASSVNEIDVLFPLINFRSMGIRKGELPGTKEEMATAIRTAHDCGKGVFAMKIFGGGNLTGHYLEAIEYVRSLPGVDSLMIGFGHCYEIDSILQVMNGTLPTDFVPTTGHKKIRIDVGDCLGCRICVERCPNKAIFINIDGVAEVDHGICLTCGYCAPACPVLAIIMY